MNAHRGQVLSYLQRFFIGILSGLGLMIVLVACSQSDDEPRIVYITATPQTVLPNNPIPPTIAPITPMLLSPVPAQPLSQPTANPPRFDTIPQSAQQYEVQSGDTLLGIATAHGISLQTLLDVNEIVDPNVLSVGQVIQLPSLPTQQTPNFKLIPDSRFVRSPESRDFDLHTFIDQQTGYIRTVTDEVLTNLADGTERREILNATQIIERVSIEYSIDPRLLLTLLEYRAGWLSNSNVANETHPLISLRDSGGVDRSGLYKQLAWTANTLNAGYYGWKMRGWVTLELRSGERYLLTEDLNAGTVGLQYLFSRNANSNEQWLFDTSFNGFYQIYTAYFGDPFANAIEPLVPSNLAQPAMVLPFSQGETWFFTGGAHGGWGSSSAWSAIDFAPPDEVDDALCYISDFWVTATSAGVITYSDNGLVILDTDHDGDDSTGWAIIYLHIAEQERIALGASVQAGDRIGRASCEGGFSTATHLHIARRYNGEWIPAYCHQCGIQDVRPIFELSGWSVIGLQNQEYQGYLERNGERRTAEQGRLTPVNRISW